MWVFLIKNQYKANQNWIIVNAINSTLKDHAMQTDYSYLQDFHIGISKDFIILCRNTTHELRNFVETNEKI